MSRKPAEVAAKEPNEYIPQFISKRPFYIDDDTAADYLEHQRLQTKVTDQSKWYDRGKRLGPASTKYRKGACENCGAMTHKTKNCLSRPRARGARWTGRDIQADEVVEDMELGWDAKRDRWNGYDAAEYQIVVGEYEELENLKKKNKGTPEAEQREKSEFGEGQIEDEEAKYAEESDMGRHQSTATRNLRLREDTAKYLLNLDLDSARYDPKTRSMIDMGAQADQAAALFAEDNLMRASGDAAAFEKAQKYAWESQERGDKDKTHVQANPTSGEYFLRIEKENREMKQKADRKILIEKYGGEHHMRPKFLNNVVVLESDRYVEYDGSGAIKGSSVALEKSKYLEDVYTNNHTSVWGSWWRDFGWGYACCHSTTKNSYCTGEDGRQALQEADQVRTGGELEDLSLHRTIGQSSNDPTLSGVCIDSCKEIMELGNQENTAGRKRTLAEMNKAVSEQELEAYKRAKVVADDPMANLLGKDELVH